MTLSEKIVELLSANIEVKFSPFWTMFEIQLTYELDCEKFTVEQQMPLSDHSYEEKIVDCIEFMETKIKEHKTGTKS